MTTNLEKSSAEDIAANLGRAIIVCCMHNLDIKNFRITYDISDSKVLVRVVLDPIIKNLVDVVGPGVNVEDHRVSIDGFKFGSIVCRKGKYIREMSKTYCVTEDTKMDDEFKQTVKKHLHGCLAAYLISEPTLSREIKNIQSEIN